MIEHSKSSPPKASNDRSAQNEVAANNVMRVARMESKVTMDVSFGDRVAALVAAFCGSMAFVWIHLVWFSGWVIYNAGPWLAHSPPDPFPFSFLTLVVSLEAIFLSAFILISQGREARLADRRSELDLQINMLAEQESTKTLHLLRRVCEKLGVDLDNDPDIDELERATRPETVLDLIERKIETPRTSGAS